MSFEPLSASATDGHGRNRIAPLLWHRGEQPEVIRREIEAIHTSGIREFILEPRPHPDYLGPQWWSDVEVVLSEAQLLGMKVWLFDDSHFPSGALNGSVRSRYPHLLKTYLAERHRDVRGPAIATTLSFGAWVRHDEQIHAVVAIRHAAATGPDPDTAVDLTDLLDEATLQWDVPEGVWRVFVILETPHGHEARTADYVNPIAEGAAEAHIATIHEPHFDHFGPHFGRVILGFFQDEPRFGNERTHEFRFGAETGDDTTYVLPYSGLLGEKLGERWGLAARARLPFLWWGTDEKTTGETRYGYMDEVTKLYERFQRTLGDWCLSHDVKLIGHVIEDNGAHARLGMGPGHYFRSMAGQSMGGADVVLQQLMPGAEEGRRPAPVHHWDDDFHYWGLAKLASSAAHIDPRKNGDALCETFGAYGWNLGLRKMKWLTDHLIVRGINYIVPHAFSARPWDDDCPPHFYNGGMNPQWDHFATWRAYTQEITEHLSGGRHLADAAVLYHAEAEWSGRYMPFERVMRELLRSQRDADVVPIDSIIDCTVDSAGVMHVGGARYPILIVPYAQRLPSTLARFLVEHALPTIFVDDFPESIIDDDGDRLLQSLRSVATTVPLNELTDRVHARVSVTPADPSLRVMRYEKDGQLNLFIVNEATAGNSHVELTVQGTTGRPVEYDPAAGHRSAPPTSNQGDTTSLRLALSAGESRLLLFRESPEPTEAECLRQTTERSVPMEGWTISTRDCRSSTFVPASFNSLGPVNAPDRLPRFAGIVRYERDVNLPRCHVTLDLGDVGESAEVFVDGRSLGVRFAPPYRFVLPQFDVPYRLKIEVATTLAPLLSSTNIFDAGTPVEATGLLGPVSLLVSGEKPHR